MPTLTDIGRLGRDAELRYTPNGDAVCNLALACEYARKGQDGKRPPPMDRRYALGQTGRDNGALPSQGQQLHFTIDDAHVETYTKSDHSQGVKLTGRVIIIKFTGGPSQQAQQGTQHQPRPQQQRPQSRPQAQPQNQQGSPGPDYNSFDDDIPFAPLHHLACW